MKNTGTIFLPSLAAVALFEAELKGQFSDGMWENSGPRDHYKFWCGVESKVAPSELYTVVGHVIDSPRKTGYNLASLYPIVGDRMLRIGRAGKALASLGRTWDAKAYTQARGVEYLPATYAEFKMIGQVLSNQPDYVREYLEAWDDELAAAYYATTYEMKDLRRDVAGIKQAMKTVRR